MLHVIDFGCVLIEIDYIENNFRFLAKNLLINHINNSNITHLYKIEDLLEKTLEDSQNW